MECENYPCTILGIGLLLNSCFKLDLATFHMYNKKKTLNMVVSKKYIPKKELLIFTRKAHGDRSIMNLLYFSLRSLRPLW